MASGRKPRRRGSLWDDIRFQFDRRWPPDRRQILAAIGILAALVVIVFGYQMMSARSALSRAAAEAELLQSQIVSGDVEGARSTLAELQSAASDAHDTTDGVLWTITSKIPWAGRNVDAIRVVSAEMDHIADVAVPPIVELAGQLNAKAFNPADGTVDITSIRDAAPDIATAATALTESRKALDKVDVDSLIAPLRGSVAAAKTKVATASAAAQNADLAARLLPDMLAGDGGTRRYLLLVQNTAESRPTGGIAGSYGVIQAKNGKISMPERGSAPDLPPVDSPVVKLTDDEKAVFPASLAQDLRDVNITPDFPRSAQIAKKLYEDRYDKKIDGVVTIDPIALSYLLAGLGPVEVHDKVTLDQNNVVAALLHQVYLAFENRDDQDDFFELATKKVFDRFAAGQGDPAATLRGLVRSVDENRIAVWSANSDEQKLIAPTDLSGRWIDDEKSPRVGVLLSDGASTKMEYFLKTATTVVGQNCLKDDRQVIAMTTDLTSSAPGSGLPITITGGGQFVKKGSMKLNVRLVSPTGGHFTSVKLDGEPVTVYADEWQGRNVTHVEVVLKPGQSRTLTANVTSAAGQDGDPVVTLTPGMSSQRNDYSIASACG